MWELEKPRLSRRLILFYKIVSNSTPPSTRSPIPNLQESPYSFRSRTAIGGVYARSEKFKSSFYPDCMCECENINPELRTASSLGIFKAGINRIIRTIPEQVYGIHDPKGLALLKQFRIWLSALSFHKFRHNFNDSLNPLCPINDGGEDRSTSCCTANHISWRETPFSAAYEQSCFYMIFQIFPMKN